ncbi:uncharacterized protein IL334_001622 [Kwoniella shivajii]|uniref:Pentatricopeptide repeat domain-containing protein n=1 Tax=Kwoniella shivajii TaxID=564305 RepID=A0ABZ1CSE9_9TREE|nr:hypothetical protein IL334_001622 [Kwoniella shivajii]
MQTPLARTRQIARLALPSLRAETKPPLCSRCLHALQLRTYTTRIQNTQRTRKTCSEFSSKERWVPVPPSSSSSRSQPSITDQLLKTEFETIVDSSSSAILLDDIKKAISAIYPLIYRRELRPLLDPYLEEISLTLSNKAESCNLSEEATRQLITILNHCWTRSIFLESPKEKVHSIEKSYAGYLFRQCTNTQYTPNLTNYLNILQSAIEKQNKHTQPLLSKELTSAWIVLRTKLNIEKKLRFTFNGPSIQSVEVYLKEIIKEEEVETYLIMMRILFKSQKREIGDIETQIQNLRRKNDYQGITSLWEEYKSQLTIKKSSNDSKEQDNTLSVFLRIFKRSSSASQSFDKQFNEVLSFCARPYSRVTSQTLLALRVKPDPTALKAGHEVISLDHEDIVSSKSDNALDNLKSIWNEMGEKDLKMYMIYLEGLGRLGDLGGLKEAWNQLVKDEKTKAIYLEEERLSPSAPFPPVQALNQMISACLLIPDGPAIALDLFGQAASPLSTIPINLITINTILRHHARQADLPSMSSLFTLAEKLKLKPDVVTYTTLVQGLLRGGKVELAKKVLEDMSSQGISPNERMCSMLIADLAKSGSSKSLSYAEELLRLMIRKGMKTNEVTWTGLISGYFKGGWERDGFETISRMERAGHKLNRIGWNMCLKQYSKSNGDNILEVWNKSLKEGISPNSDSYFLVLNPLVAMKKWDEAYQVINEMNKRRFRPEKGTLRNLVERVKYRR